MLFQRSENFATKPGNCHTLREKSHPLAIRFVNVDREAATPATVPVQIRFVALAFVVHAQALHPVMKTFAVFVADGSFHRGEEHLQQAKGVN